MRDHPGKNGGLEAEAHNDDEEDDDGIEIVNVPSEEIKPLSSSSSSPTNYEMMEKRRFRRNSLPRILIMVGFGVVFVAVFTVLILNLQSGGNGNTNSNSNGNSNDNGVDFPNSNGSENSTGANGGADEDYKETPVIATSTDSPTKSPTMLPTKNPTSAPTVTATLEPTISPTKAVTEEPTTKSPTAYPTIEPTLTPSKSKSASSFVSLTDGIMYDLQTEEPLYHDKTHFTQGLTYSKKSDILFESNGLYHRSSLCRLNPHTGEALLCKSIESDLFAEGMQVYTNKTASNAIENDVDVGDNNADNRNDNDNDNDNDNTNERLIQITWKSLKGFIYDASTLERISEFTFSTTRNEGWGICYDEVNDEFIVSDGSNVLHFWDANTLEEKRRVEVYRHSGAKANDMNELEFVGGKVLANVWYQDVILVIDPVTGVCESEYGKI